MNGFSLRDVIWQSFAQPRRAAGAILGMGFGWPVVWLIVATAVVIDVLIYQVLMLAFLPAMPAGEAMVMGDMGATIPGIVIRVLSVFVVAAIAMGVGRMTGHPADFLRVSTAAAWVSLVTAILGVAQVLGLMLPAVLGMMLNIAVSVLGIWVFGGFMAEAFRARSTGKVILLAFGVSLVFVLGIAVLLAALGVPVPEGM